MESYLAIAIGILVTAGVYLVLRPRLFSILLGTTLLSYAVNLFLLASGGVLADTAPLTDRPGPWPDPLPQALVLTAIVISFGMTALVIVLALRAVSERGHDRVDASPGGADE
jgi:multicomponent K+:H+ antiporter subunit C